MTAAQLLRLPVFSLAIALGLPGRSCPGLQPSFDWVSKEGYILFTNTTNMLGLPVDSVNWDMGDGTVYLAMDSVQHTYATTTAHTVRMHLWLFSGCHYTVDALVAHGDANDICTAEISPGFFTEQPANNMIDFTNSSISSGAGLTYGWVFGDGSPPDLGYSPTHVYAVPGTYQTALTMAGQDSSTLDGCAAGLVKTILVDGNASTCDSSLFVDFSMMDLGGSVHVEAIVQPYTTALVVNNYSWYFGDLIVSMDNTSTADHAYPYPGLYQVCLSVTAYDSTGVDSCVAYVCHTFVPALLGVEESGAIDDLRISPIPFQDEFYIRDARLEGREVEVFVFDPRGSVVHRTRDLYQKELLLRPGHLAPGTYIVRAVTDTGQLHALVVKQ